MTRKPFLFSSIVFFLTIVVFNGFSRPISGSSSIRLASPATNEIREKALSVASGYFITDCIEWMKEQAGITIDTQNAIWKYHLSTFTQKCLKLAKQESAFSGRDWTITLTLSSEQAESALKEHNAQCHRVSLSSWTNLKKLLEKGANGEVFRLGIQAIFFSMGRMEKELDVPGIEEPGSFLVGDARAIMQDFIDKIVIRPKEYIITGKSGTTMSGPLILEAIRDTDHIANFDLVINIGKGRNLFFGKTGSDGILTVQKFRIPCVAKGTLLYVSPDFGAAVNNVCSFTALDMGIKFPQQTLLLNVEPATFALHYSATAASDLSIPKDFAQDGFLRKYLQDSCFLKPAPSDGAADFHFTVTTQVSSYSNDSTEMTHFKAENAVMIQDNAKTKLAEKTALVYEQAFETNTTIPMGLFFWDAAKKSSHMIKDMLDGL